VAFAFTRKRKSRGWGLAEAIQCCPVLAPGLDLVFKVISRRMGAAHCVVDSVPLRSAQGRSERSNGPYLCMPARPTDFEFRPTIPPNRARPVLGMNPRPPRSSRHGPRGGGSGWQSPTARRACASESRSVDGVRTPRAHALLHGSTTYCHHRASFRELRRFDHPLPRRFVGCVPGTSGRPARSPLRSPSHLALAPTQTAFSVRSGPPIEAKNLTSQRETRVVLGVPAHYRGVPALRASSGGQCALLPPP